MSVAQNLVQRAYNAFAVRVLDASLGSNFSTGAERSAGGTRVVPASETDEGELCVEMRIRLYPDGAMSKLLDQRATVSSVILPDNAK